MDRERDVGKEKPKFKKDLSEGAMDAVGRPSLRFSLSLCTVARE